MKTRILTLIIPLFFLLETGFSQVAINEDESLPHPSAALDVKSTSKGLLPPRLSLLQRDNIPDPAPGLLIYNTSSKNLEMFDGTKWRTLIGEFQCGTSQVEDDDGNFYSTLKIGDVCWMAENLNVGLMINNSQYQSNNGTIEKHCYNDNPEYCAKYGGIYSWNEAMQYNETEGTRGICPNGWHIPTKDEWSMIVSPFGGSGVAGGNLKSTRTEPDPHPRWNQPNTGATNNSEFSGLPAGYYETYAMGGGAILRMGLNTYWSTSTKYDGTRARVIKLNHDDDNFNYSKGPVTQGYSVRCVKD